MTQAPPRRLAPCLALVVAALVLLPPAAAGTGTEEEAAESFITRLPGGLEVAAKPARELPSRRFGLDAAAAPQVALSTLDHEALLLEDRLAEREALTKVRRFGVGRDLTLHGVDGAWTDLPDGSRLWTADVVSPGALGMRLHLAELRLPAGAELVIWGGEPEGGGAPLARAAPSAEHYYGSAATPARLWTGTIAGERAHLEYLAPAGSSGDELPFRLDRLQHLYRDPLAEQALAKAAGPCHNQVACYPDWDDTARAVAGIGFIGNNALFCTGQLLNIAKGADFTPYFLTANHCLDTQFEAESVEVFWLYQTAACGGAIPSLTSVPRSRGTTLLSTHPQSDYTLLMVEGALGRALDQLAWAGWTSKEPSNGTPAVGIHHPRGDHKRISFADKDAGANACNSNFPGRALVRSSWTTAAITEPGSSGSGLFREDTGQLFGQLLGGPSYCGVGPSGAFDCYGSFASTYARIKSYLSKGGADDKSEQNDSCAKARKLKNGTTAGRIVKLFDEDWYRVDLKGGQTIDFDISFFHVNGDIDLEVYGSCKTGRLEISNGVGDGEGFRVTNSSSKTATVYFRVFLVDDTRNSYDISLH